ncbi:hypothetical protein [Mucilaginibacter terrae]|nr:hypothetical protein [Mucilaginibacter terrae]
MKFNSFWYIKIIGIVLITGIIIISCSMQKPQQITQGIEGQVTRLSGNQMPMKGRLPAQGKGLLADILIYEATTIQQTEGQIPLFNNIKTHKIGQTKSDSTGHYKISLPPGNYSVFMKFNGKFFASETDGKGTLNPAEVINGKITQRNITVNVGAAY